MASAFRERQVFRIDHYLGKETVQNILVLRFANGIFEPVWNRNFIDHVQITVAESLGVEGRGRFYEEAGAMRDIVQNHLLQVLSFVAMEPPGSFDVESVRNERAKVLATLRQLGTADVVRGQYDAGFAGGNAVPAYRDEEGVDPNSLTETYVAARLAVDNWRWAEVPFYVRTGKRLAKRVSEVAIQFKRVPHLPFSYAAAEQLEPNVLVLRIQPNEGIALRFGAKVPSTRTQIRTVNMDFDYDTAFATAPAEAYETLLVDALRGDATNFIRIDAVTDAWRVVDPVIHAWQNEGGAPHLYAVGRLGPGRRRRPARARRAQVAPAVSAIAAVEERLAELRGGERGEARTQLLDLVVLTDEPREAERMARLLEELPGNRPSRAIIALATRGKSRRSTRAPRSSRPRSPSGDGELRCELVHLAAGDEGAALPSLIASLLLPDLPVFLLLRLDPERWERLVADCWSFATRVVVDSTGERSGLHSLPGLLAREPHAQRHRPLVDEADRLARARRAPLRSAQGRARARAPRPHRDRRTPAARRRRRGCSRPGC